MKYHHNFYLFITVQIRYVAILKAKAQAHKNNDMRQDTNILAQFKQWILSIVMYSLQYFRYKILNTWHRIKYHKVFMSKERKKERKDNADALFKEIMKEKFGV